MSTIYLEPEALLQKCEDLQKIIDEVEQLEQNYIKNCKNFIEPMRSDFIDSLDELIEIYDLEIGRNTLQNLRELINGITLSVEVFKDLDNNIIPGGVEK